MAPLRVIVVSTFFPNASAPFRTVFVRNLVTAMSRHAQVRVVNAVPYAPPWPARRRWQLLRKVPRFSVSGEIEVEHPRVVVVPKVPVATGLSYALAVARSLWRAARREHFDIIHVHCAFPDAVGVALVAGALRIPFVITAHGSDINVYSKRRELRPQIRWALARARAVIAVSEDLRQKIRALAPEASERVHCVPCSGFDPAVFHVGDRAAARAAHALSPGSRVALFVGNLVPIKGVDTLLAAWRLLLETGEASAADRLILIGDGPLRSQFEQAAAASGFAGTVRLLGALPQGEIASWLRAASVLCLSSRHEGMPNVVIEALASGTPVMATSVGGVPELVKPGTNGYLAASGDAREFAQGLARTFVQKWDSYQIASTASGYNWADLAARNLDVLTRAVH